MTRRLWSYRSASNIQRNCDRWTYHRLRSEWAEQLPSTESKHCRGLCNPGWGIGPYVCNRAHGCTPWPEGNPAHPSRFLQIEIDMRSHQQNDRYKTNNDISLDVIGFIKKSENGPSYREASARNISTYWLHRDRMAARRNCWAVEFDNRANFSPWQRLFHFKTWTHQSIVSEITNNYGAGNNKRDTQINTILESKRIS